MSEMEIRKRLQAVADRSLDVWDFADWLDSYAWNMHRDSAEADIKFVARIQHLFAEYDLHGDESVLRHALGEKGNLMPTNPPSPPTAPAGIPHEKDAALLRADGAPRATDQ